MTEKKNGRPTQPGSHSASNQRSRRKPKPILHRLAAKSKHLTWRRIAVTLLVLLTLFSLVWFAATIGKEPPRAREPETTTAAPTQPPEPTQPPAYVFIYGKGCPVNMEAVTDAWATEAGFEKRYTITDEERYDLASAITAEATGEPFAGKVAVAQCVLQACEDDGIRPNEALEKYKYSSNRPEPADESLAAVAAVFDFGHVATSEPIKYFYAPDLVTSIWHESQTYVMTINNHKFFKEAQHGQGNQEPDRARD